MKFRTLLDFYNWLTISTGDLKQDFEALKNYWESEDFLLITDEMRRIFYLYKEVVNRLSLEQQELELK